MNLQAQHATRRRGSGERGDATVQAVALVPLTMLLLFAIIQFAVAWYAKTALTAAAEDGLRAAQINHISPEAAARDSAKMNAGFVDGVSTTSTVGVDRITVTIRGKVPAAFPGFQWTITGTASGPAETFRIQGG
jgi:Flp pilus assembly protein TadG